MKGTMKKAKTLKVKPHGHWANCFLEHAALETERMRVLAKNCEYQSAHDAGVRRGMALEKI